MVSLSIVDTIHRRECGNCSECCTVKEFVIQEPMRNNFVTKDEWRRCPMLAPTHGCLIHAYRPAACRKYFCQWLMNPMIPDDFKPNNSKVILDIIDVDGLQCFLVTECAPKASRDREIESFLWVLSQSCVVFLKEYQSKSEHYQVSGPPELLDIVNSE